MTARPIRWLVCVWLCSLPLHAYAGDNRELTLAQPLAGADTQVIAGRATAQLFSGPLEGGAHLRLDLMPVRYPLPSGQDPAYEYIVNPPVTTDRIRYVTDDNTAHITEIRLFEPGMPIYPDVMSEGGGVGLVNFALNAPVTASSRWANERHERRAVDGSIAFESRWVSDGPDKRPHWLAIDLQQPRAIGCIQMVSGYPSGSQWLQVARNFRFEHYQNGAWREIPGSGRQPNAEPSSMAITLAAAAGVYYLTHSQQVENWTLSYVPAGGSAQVIGSLELPGADVRQAVGLRIELLVTSQTATFLVNGQAVYSFDHALDGTVSIGVASLSTAVELHLGGISTRVAPAASSTLLADVRITSHGAPAPPFRFHPFHGRQDYALASDAISEITVTALPAVSGQQVTIMGQPTATAVYDTRGQAVIEVPVRVISADGNATQIYRIRVTPVPPWDGYELAFADEFGGAVLDDVKWSYRVGTRWNSIQRQQNVVVQNGRLIIRLEVDSNGQQYTGGVISRERLGHGYYETRARLWKHPGWHAAFWQMQTSGAAAGTVNEIDGFESLYPDRFMTNLQYYRPRHILGSTTHLADVAGAFNTYGWEWLPDRVRFYFNGQLIRESDYPGPHMPANVWLSCVAHTTASTKDLPGTIEFDYFRYYRPAERLGDALADALIVGTQSGGYRESGTWESSDAAVSHRGDFQTRLSRQSGNSAEWSATVANSGLHEVFVWNPYVFHDGTVSEAIFRVSHAQGVSERVINPMRDGQAWVSLGRYRFSNDKQAVVTLLTTSSQPQRADAVAFLPVVSSLEDQVRVLFPTAIEWAAGQITGTWIGDFTAAPDRFPQIAHPHLGTGFLFDGGTDDSLVLYLTASQFSNCANRIGWVFAHRTDAQYLYSYARAAWLYWAPHRTDALWLFDFATGAWVNYTLDC
jgi:beta-glucanase (GH16 family)